MQRSAKALFFRNVVIGLVVTAFAATACGGPGVASSGTYSMEYAGVGVSGAPASSGTYSTIGIIRTVGAGVAPAASARYTLTSVTGSAPSPAAKVTSWRIY